MWIVKENGVTSKLDEVTRPFEDLQELVKGYIQIIKLGHWTLFVDEEAPLKGKKVNAFIYPFLANIEAEYKTKPKIAFNQLVPLAGDILVMTKQEEHACMIAKKKDVYDNLMDKYFPKPKHSKKAKKECSCCGEWFESDKMVHHGSYYTCKECDRCWVW